VLLVSEEDYQRVMTDGGSMNFNEGAMPLLTIEKPASLLKPPSAGQWRIVYQTEDAILVSAAVV
jgi:hypothetical protein